MAVNAGADSENIDSGLLPVIQASTGSAGDEMCDRCEKSHYYVIVGGNSFVAITKICLGLIGRSHALFADGIHSLGDVLGAVITVISINIAKRPKNKVYPWGYGKVEFVAASAIYISLACVGIYIFTSAVQHLILKMAIRPHMVAVMGAIISLVTNEFMYRQGICCGVKKSSPSIIAAAHENRADMWSSLVILVGIVGAKLGAWYLDPLAAILVSYFIFKLCYENLKETMQGLLDSAVEPNTRQSILDEIQKYPGIWVTDLRTRKIGRHIDVEIDARVDPKQSLKELEVLKLRIQSDVLRLVDNSGEVVFYFSAMEPSSGARGM